MKRATSKPALKPAPQFMGFVQASDMDGDRPELAYVCDSEQELAGWINGFNQAKRWTDGVAIDQARALEIVNTEDEPKVPARKVVA